LSGFAVTTRCNRTILGMALSPRKRSGTDRGSVTTIAYGFVATAHNSFGPFHERMQVS
jgi:hypothetical protein